MKKVLIVICLLWITQLISAKELDKCFRLLPHPQSIVLTQGKGMFYHELTFIVAEGETPIPVLGSMVDQLPRYKKTGKGIYLKISEQAIPESPEGYTLEINSFGVTISAREYAGLFYGCQTLEQLMEDSRDFNKQIPCMQITDYPTLTYRAVHFDNKHHLDRIEYYYRAIDKLAHYKINAVIWEIDDKLRYTRRPEVGAPNAISKQEMVALCRYAKERNIEISPLIQGLGHAGFILKHHWELRENPASDWEFCPSDSRTYEVQFDLYRDALEAMPYGKYLHVGGDEITAIGIDDRCKQTGKTAFELQMFWLDNVCRFAEENGRTPIFWDDMPLKYAGLWNILFDDMPEEELAKIWNTEKLDAAIEMFPKNCIYMRWNYDDPTLPAHQKILQWYHGKGLKVMGATGAATGDSPFMPRNHSRTPYIKDFNRLVAENQLEGILATCWDDGSPHWETVWRGFIAQGEFGWNPYTRTIEEYKDAHAQREYGFRPEEKRMLFLDELEKSLFFFDGALVEEGRRNPAWGTTHFKVIELPDKNNPGMWKAKYQDKLNQAITESARYEEIKKNIGVAKLYALRNRYTLEIYEQTNHLQNYPTRLLLALQSYDQSSSESERITALMQIRDVRNYFHEMRNSLETVYSKTRFMQNPEGYIADMNHHNHLASITDNSDWLYLFELEFLSALDKWLKAND